MTTKQIQGAINLHGAAKVRSAAVDHMGGVNTKLVDMGFTPKTLGDVYEIMDEAYKQMGPALKAIQDSKFSAELESSGSQKHSK